MTYSDDRTARLWNIATSRKTLSGVPLNNLLKDHVRLELVSEDGNVILEPEGENGLRFVRLPTLAEIDAQLRSESKPL